MLFPVSRRIALSPKWTRNLLWRQARAVPSLDLRFAENKSLVDATTGQNLVTFTRASSGTFVGSDGLIRTAVTNLLLRSEEFNDASWSSVNTNVTADAIAAPNGTLTADLLTSNTTVNNSKRRQQSLTTIASVPYTLTCYFKLANASIPHAGLSLTSGLDASTYVTARWNLSTGANTLGTANGAFTFTSQSITSIGDGWYRCSVTGIISSATDMTIVIYGSPSGTAIGSGLRGAQTVVTAVNDPVLYAWGAQLERSSTVGEYIPTTSTINSAPRFDHNPTTGESLGLLVEESRTNLLLQSNGFDTTWTNTNSSETAASGTAPDGSNTAWEVKDTVDGSSVAHNLLQTISFTSGVTYTISCWFKKGTLSGAGLGFPSSAFTSTTVSRFNLDTGTVAAAGSGTTNTITAFPSGWYRCTMSLAATATTTGAVQVRVSTTDSNNYQGAGTGTILIWGAQLEAGAFPTSYIPTTTATVTRSADVASISGSNFSSWYRQDEGTLYAEGSVPVGVSSARALASISDGTNNERIIIGHNGTTAANGLVVDANTSQTSFTITANSFPPGERKKVALAYKVDDFGFTIVPGTTTAQDSSGTVPTVDQLQIGNAPGRTEPNQPIQRLVFWPRRLGNEVLQGITQ